MNEQSIFVAALEKKTAKDRKAFLDEACGQNTDLRAQVEALLAADTGAGSFLEHPPAGLDLPVNATLIGTDSDTGLSRGALSFLEKCEKPDRIGKIGIYEVIEVVGQGGMGLVLRALDTKLSRIVAVKVMAQELAANPMAVKRFLREAQSAAAVVHDHVVTIHAVDDRSQPPYLVMEFVQGQTLQQKIDREGALQLRHILRIGSQTATGLAAAHRTGLIHRDVKPANILLENGVERVKITDFGLARAADDFEMTKAGMIAGTPQYMSPEQANGGQIDFRSDLFSLGSVLYTMCTGRPAFRAETTMATLRRVTDDLPRPIREVNAEIPEWLNAIVQRLLAKNPDDRFQSAAEVAELLSQHLAHLQNPSHVSRPAVRELQPDHSGVPALPRRKKLVSRAGLVGGLIGLALVIAVAAFGHSVMRFAFNQGTLQFVGAQGVNQARIEIDRNGELVDVLTFPVDRQIDLQSGDYQLDVTQVPPPSGVLAATLLFPKTISVRRGQVQRVEISWWRAAPANALDAPAIAAAVTEEGWTQLFNGKDLAGWKTLADQSALWRVEDGVLVGRYNGSSGYLFTERGNFKDFHLRVEGRLNDEGNAGIVFRTEADASVRLNKEGTLIPAGYEADINLAASQPARTGTLWRTGSPVRLVKKSLIQPDKWFTMEVLTQGQNVVVKINGEEVVSYDETDEDLLRQGHIGLQIAWPEVSKVEFRKIELKELPATEKNGTHLAKNRLTTNHLAQGELRRINRRPSSFVTQLRVSPDGDSLFTASDDGFIQQLPLKTGGISQTMQSHTASLDAFAVSANGTRLLAGYQDGTIVLWEGSPFAVKRKLVGHSGDVRGLAFTSDGGRAVSCSADWHNRQDATVRLWNVETGDEVHKFNCRYFANLSVAISPDDHQVLVGAQMVNSRGLSALFDLESGQLDREFPGFYSDVWHVEVSPDGSRALTTHMALAEKDGLWDDPENCVVRLWDVTTGVEVCRMRGHRSGILCAAFSPDGKYVVSASGPQHDTSGRFKEASDRSVRIWDAETGAELQLFLCEKPPIGVVFAHDGRSVFSAGGESYVREWRVSTPGFE